MPRFDQIDILRGTFFIPMFIFHLFSIYDLTFHTNHSGKPFISFLGNVRLLYIILSGVSLYLCSVNYRDKDNETFTQKRIYRSIHIGIYALLLTIISHLFYPGKGIKFGILHFIALATLLISPIAYSNSIPLTIICLIISCIWKIPSINKPIDTILGGSIPYQSADWFPVQDYLKFMLFGLLLAQIVIPYLPAYTIDPNKISEKILKWMGIESLELYAAHVIVIMVVYVTISRISC
jgi:uncharacterized membrane protein